MKRIRIFCYSVLATGILMITANCDRQNNIEAEDGGTVESGTNHSQSFEKKGKARITFVELGSVNCIPCRKMQPVLQSLEEKYGEQLEVIFYDVWREDQKQYAGQYGIRLIPTQVFLNDRGKEIYRHEGFFPEAEIDKLLQKHGLTVQTKGTSGD